MCDSVINAASSNGVFKGLLCEWIFKITFQNKKEKIKNKNKIEIKLISYEKQLDRHENRKIIKNKNNEQTRTDKMWFCDKWIN